VTSRAFAIIVGAIRSEVPDDWHPVTLDGLPDEPFDLTAGRFVITASVTQEEAMRAVLVAAARGCSVVVDVRLDEDATAGFVEDLGRIIEVRPSGTPARLDSEHRALMERLATGQTLVEAALQLGWSRRTATRRLSDAKRRLAASSTATAIRVFRAAT
jgi:DNA-binding NarL/FixJ family response regulator